MTQGPYEAIAEFKLRSTRVKEAYDDAGNAELSDEDVAMDFLMALDNGRYAKFKIDVENDAAKGIPPPGTLNAMFLRASTYKVERSSYRASGGAAFATRADEFTRPIKPNKPNQEGKNNKGNKADKDNNARPTKTRRSTRKTRSQRQSATCRRPSATTAVSLGTWPTTAPMT